MNKLLIGVISFLVLGSLGYLFWENPIIQGVILTLTFITGIVLGGLLTVTTVLLAAPFFPRLFKHDPDNQTPVQLYVEVGANRAVAIERAGNPIRIIIGEGEIEGIQREIYGEVVEARSPILGDALYNLFSLYERYVYRLTGNYAFVPFITKPKVLPLPRYEIRQIGGRNKYVPIEEGDPKYFTNHVRTSLTTWYFEYKGIEVQGVPFTIFGSIQYSIDPQKVAEALYKTNAWNGLLDQASYSVIRRVVRSKATLEGVIGRVEKDLWQEPGVNEEEEEVNRMAENCLKALTEYTFEFEKEGGGEGIEKLSDVGIRIHGVLFNDLDPEIEGQELVTLRAPAIKQRQARGDYLLGSAVAENQEKLVQVHGKDSSSRIIDGEAHVRAVQDGGGVVEALISSLTQNQRSDKK